MLCSLISQKGFWKIFQSYVNVLVFELSRINLRINYTSALKKKKQKIEKSTFVSKKKKKMLNLTMVKKYQRI